MPLAPDNFFEVNDAAASIYFTELQLKSGKKIILLFYSQYQGSAEI